MVSYQQHQHQQHSHVATHAITTKYQSVIAGVIAGCVTRSCTSPLDVLKIVIQVNGPTLTRASGAAMRVATSMSHSRMAAAAGFAKNPSVIYETFRRLYATEGVRGFWKGNLAGCCRLGPYSGAKFFIYDALQTQFLTENPSNLQRASCGGAAGLMATMATYPLEVIRTHIITQCPRSPQRIQGVFHGIRTIFQAEGVRGLYKGGVSGIVGAIPFEGVQFGCYEYLKLRATTNRWPACRWPQHKQELDAIDYLVCGSVSGAVAQTVAYPFDTVKKRLQTQAIVPYGRKYYGMVDCFQKVVRDEGLSALYRGTVPNLARIVPYAAVMFSTFEMTKKSLQLLTSTN